VLSVRGSSARQQGASGPGGSLAPVVLPYLLCRRGSEARSCRSGCGLRGSSTGAPVGLIFGRRRIRPLPRASCVWCGRSSRRMLEILRAGVEPIHPRCAGERSATFSRVGLDRQEVARALRLSSERIRQIEAAAFRKVRLAWLVLLGENP